MPARRDARKLDDAAQLELRHRAIDLKKNKKLTHREVAVVLEVSEGAVRKWWQIYKSEGMKGLKLGKRGRREGACRSLGREEERKVRRIIEDKTPDQLKMPFALWTRQAVGELIEQSFGLRMPVRTVGEYLRRWGFTPQRPKKRAYEQQPEEVRRWLDESYPAIEARARKEGAEIHWGDETGVSNADQRGRGYAPRGRTPVAEQCARKFSASMISTVTNRGKLRFMIYKGALNQDVFLKFLKRLVKGAPRKIFLVVDNLRVHRARKVSDWVEANSELIELFFLPPYCPELNPDEYLNNATKSRLRSKAAPRSQQELAGNLRSATRSMQKRPKIVASLFQHPGVRYAA